MTDITIRERRNLEAAAKHPDGVFRTWPAFNGLAKINNERTIEKLVKAGLIEPNAHGDHYITTAGRCAIGQPPVQTACEIADVLVATGNG